VLFGTAAQNRVRITAWRPIACEHAQGPTFVLSQQDRAGLARLLQSAGDDPNLRGLQPVGWALSHTRSDVCLSPADLDIYAGFFPASWQVTLVLQPEKAGSCRAGFFVRDADGSVQSGSSYREFSIGPGIRAAVAPAPARTPGDPPQVKAIPKPDAAPALPHQPFVRTLPPLPPRAPARVAQSSTRSKWIWALLIAGALIAGAVYYYFGKSWMPADRSFLLRVADHNGQLRFEWDKDSPAIRGARGASIEVTDQGSTQRFPLSAEQVKEGTFTYTRHSGEVSTRMMVLLEDGSPIEEAANYTGPPPATEGPSQEVLELRAERDQLKAEVQRLKDQIQKKKPKPKRRY
jgi:hypothetical protein